MSQNEKKYLTWQLIRKGNYYNGAVTEEMLKELSETFGKNGDVPIGIGHMNYFFDDSRPAEGWIDSKKEFGIDAKGNFVTKGVTLFEPLKTMYEEGRYKNWSVVIARPRIYNEKKDNFDLGKWELRAVDMLGRATPAVKNLKDLTAQTNQSALSKFTIENENVIKFTDTGNELEIMHFSLSGEIEISQNSNNNHEGKTMNEFEKQLSEMKAQLDEQQKAFSETMKKNEEELKRLTSERDKATERAAEAMKKFAETEKAKLAEATNGLPEEMKTKLFAALEKSVNIEMVFGDEASEKQSMYSILADVFKQITFSVNPEFTADLPKDMKPEAGEVSNVYSNGRKLVKKMFS